MEFELTTRGGQCEQRTANDESSVQSKRSNEYAFYIYNENWDWKHFWDFILKSNLFQNIPFGMSNSNNNNNNKLK